MAGLLLVGSIAAAGIALSVMPWAQSWGLGALTLAIVVGMMVGNTVFPRMSMATSAGVDFSKSSLLRLGIVLYGFRVTMHDIAGVGLSGLAVDVFMVASVFGLACWLGTRVLGLDREIAMLIGAGSAICGAAAVMATEPVVRAQAHKVSVAVATVVIFGTLGMFLYPWLYPWLGMGEHGFGIYAGSTIHEVAQVVVAGKAVGEAAASAAVIEKLLRVMLLAPFLLLLSAWLNRAGRRSAAPDHPASGITVPWFAVAFIVVSGINSLQVIPAVWVERIVAIDTLLLAMAMAALGLRTHAGAIRRAGKKPLLLAAALFVYLVVVGWAVNVAVAAVADRMSHHGTEPAASR